MVLVEVGEHGIDAGYFSLMLGVGNGWEQEE